MKRPGLISVVFWSAWCGMLAGLLEAGTIVLRKQIFDPNQLYGMSRHFVWLIPVANLCVFVALGLIGFVVALAWPSPGRWLLVRGMCALTIMPVFLVAFSRVYSLAWIIVALGVAARVAPRLERHARESRRIAPLGFALTVAIVATLAATRWTGDWMKHARARARPVPSPGSPNVVLIVLDTVAAGHLSLYGYERATSTTLVELAERGIRFDSAQAPSSWTLPSHATMFTARWMHELSVGWLSPLDDAFPTLGEVLEARGYSTAGFIANTAYCASDSGLGRGFTDYQDYILPRLTLFKLSVLVSRALAGIQASVDFVDAQQDTARLQPYIEDLWRWLVADRKTAAVVNREFLGWLSRRAQPERPFFAFLNYGDAHTPYQLPPGRLRRFGHAPTDLRQVGLIQHWADMDTALLSPQQIAFAADAYDDCIADLDEQVGKLVDELARRGVLDRTWVIVTADHGESFGEHAGVFCHGMSLYQTELHVPLLVVPPGGSAIKRVVKETVSLRDLAATCVDLLDLEPGSPFPGDSLARFWDDKAARPNVASSSSEPALAEVIPIDPHNRDADGLPKKTWPLGGFLEGDWSYIRREGDVREELFHVGDDARQQRNLADDPAALPVLERMRQSLGRLTAGPLRPERFNR